MKTLARRLGDLERLITPLGPRAWHTVVVDGQSDHEALAKYEAENGPIDAGDGVIFWVVVDPEPLG